MQYSESGKGKIAGILVLIIFIGLLVYGIVVGDMNYIGIEGATL